ncbi:UNKNOWN [Stylonychia lemnae]|uniref:Uncharacterized protein n=1 Tax=Stylonychia lemnae TaxID=5949 RepID=A0A078AA22_STYLE|nr:UNKNOWN [Stylonychia lemnae]|eukprot:CDW78402.1 UNKNOWN [Stylonychia lemnae]
MSSVYLPQIINSSAQMVQDLNSSQITLPKKKKTASYGLIFSDGQQQQELNDDAIKKSIIDLNFRQLQDFEEPGTSQVIQKVRFQHYQDKRKNNLDIIERMIKISKGLYQPGENGSPMMRFNRSTQSTNRLNSTNLMFKSRLISTQLKNMRNASYDQFENENHNRSMISSQPDIPLREPLDFEFRLNRKMAKKIYEEEKKNKVLENKEKVKLDQVQQLKNLVQTYEKKEKKYVKEKKEGQQVLQHRIMQVKQRREQILDKKQRIMMMKEQELRQKEELIEQEYQKFQKKREEKIKAQQEELFLIDLEREREKKDKTGKTMMIKLKLEIFEQKLKTHEDKKIQEVEKVKERMSSINKKVEESKFLWTKEEYEQQQMHLAKKTYSRIIKSEKMKQDQINSSLYQIKTKNERRIENANLKQQEIMRKEIDKIRYLENRVKQRNDLIDEFYEAFKEDMDQKKELSFLRKIDQMENLQRTKNFYNMYRTKLIEKIQDKMNRAELVKENKERIREMYLTNHNLKNNLNRTSLSVNQKSRGDNGDLNKSSYL